jgi:hypothetical protein
MPSRKNSKGDVMTTMDKMSFSKKLAWVLTVIFLAWILISGLYEGSILVLFIFVIMVCLVGKHGPSGLLLFFILMSAVGILGFLANLMDSVLPPT